MVASTSRMSDGRVPDAQVAGRVRADSVPQPQPAAAAADCDQPQPRVFRLDRDRRRSRVRRVLAGRVALSAPGSFRPTLAKKTLTAEDPRNRESSHWGHAGTYAGRTALPVPMGCPSCRASGGIRNRGAAADRAGVRIVQTLRGVAAAGGCGADGLAGRIPRQTRWPLRGPSREAGTWWRLRTRARTPVADLLRADLDRQVAVVAHGLCDDRGVRVPVEARATGDLDRGGGARVERSSTPERDMPPRGGHCRVRPAKCHLTWCLTTAQAWFSRR